MLFVFSINVQCLIVQDSSVQVIPKKIFTKTHHLLTLMSIKNRWVSFFIRIISTVLLGTFWRSLYGRVHYFVNYCSTNENSSKQSPSSVNNCTSPNTVVVHYWMNKCFWMNLFLSKWLNYTPLMYRLIRKQAKWWVYRSALEMLLGQSKSSTGTGSVV